MRKLQVVVIFLILIFQACSSDKPDVITTKSGLYGSKKGEFLIKFPEKPNVMIQENMLANQKFDAVTFLCSMGIEQKYVVSYVDFPPPFFNSIDIEQFFDQSAEAMDRSSDYITMGSRTVGENDGFDKSITYKMFSPQTNINGHITMKMIKAGTRIYTIMYAAARNRASNEVVDEFVNSFKLYKPKQ
ncbi:hypothetical protein R9C00_06310 [Flammeovirgaceae bacterium SG7u.111]|nr:hypothetical protein [Flammeovirgaceae bacterium SG7u.132]WPO37055.1 hypothetical protein R9C00_06310 [Flammeovirgaceae bacterium SG7u.111]